MDRKIIKTYWFVVFFVLFSLFGCSSVRSALSNINDSLQDSESLAVMQDVKKSVSDVVSVVSSVSPVFGKFGTAFAVLISNLASLGTGVYLGNKKIKKVG